MARQCMPLKMFVFEVNVYYFKWPDNVCFCIIMMSFYLLTPQLITNYCDFIFTCNNIYDTYSDINSEPYLHIIMMMTN